MYIEEALRAKKGRSLFYFVFVFPKQSRLSVGVPLGISQSPYLGKFPATSGFHEILLKNESLFQLFNEFVQRSFSRKLVVQTKYDYINV